MCSCACMEGDFQLKEHRMNWSAARCPGNVRIGADPEEKEVCYEKGNVLFNFCDRCGNADRLFDRDC